MSAPLPQYVYRASVIRVVDGDTAWLAVDPGFDLSLKMSVRFMGINAPEINTEAGRMARDWLNEMLPPGTQVVLVTSKDKREKYGRYLGTVWLGDQCLNEVLIAQGWAVVYP